MGETMRAAEASADRTPSAVVETENGRVQGYVFRGISIFRGLPYGAPTSGSARFLPPRPPLPWHGVRAARHYGETAPQAPGPLAEGGTPGDRPAIGEDCLRLNIWTPAADQAARPVMVWLHGGGFEAGSGSSMLYDGVNLCRRGDVVAVSINHRLGVFGHCHLPEFAGADFAGSANAGFLDIVAALRWVRTNIAGFGGNPANVTIYGQSGGGRKVSLALAAPVASGLFHRAVVQSGSHLRLMSAERAGDLAERLLYELQIKPAETRRLQSLPVDQLLRAGAAVAEATGLRFSPTLDQTVFTCHPWDPAAPQFAADIPMMIGTCRTELSSFLSAADPAVFSLDEAGLARRLENLVPREDIADLTRLFQRTNPQANPAELLFKIGTARGYWRDSVLQTERKAVLGAAPVYSWRLMWRTPVDGGRLITPHSLDLPFVFDNVTKAPLLAGPPGAETASLARAMSESWLAFARTGDPNNAAIPEWRPYELARRDVMLFDTVSASVADPLREERLAMARYPTQQLGRTLNPSGPAWAMA